MIVTWKLWFCCHIRLFKDWYVTCHRSSCRWPCAQPSVSHLSQHVSRSSRAFLSPGTVVQASAITWGILQDSILEMFTKYGGQTVGFYCMITSWHMNLCWWKHYATTHNVILQNTMWLCWRIVQVFLIWHHDISFFIFPCLNSDIERSAIERCWEYYYEWDSAAEFQRVSPRNVANSSLDVGKSMSLSKETILKEYKCIVLLLIFIQ